MVLVAPSLAYHRGGQKILKTEADKGVKGAMTVTLPSSAAKNGKKVELPENILILAVYVLAVNVSFLPLCSAKKWFNKLCILYMVKKRIRRSKECFIHALSAFLGGQFPQI